MGYFNKKEKSEGDNPPIGVILSQERDELLVEYARLRNKRPAIVSKYQLYLPNKEELRALLNNELEYLSLKKIRDKKNTKSRCIGICETLSRKFIGLRKANNKIEISSYFKVFDSSASFIFRAATFWRPEQGLCATLYRRYATKTSKNMGGVNPGGGVCRRRIANSPVMRHKICYNVLLHRLCGNFLHSEAVTFF
jgi:hypothetical protein